MSMELTKRLWEQPTDKGVLAYHIIQSFSPGEATPNQVHKIGCEFARRFLADRFECTVSTHLDKGHLHNHIVVNSVSYADGKMFRKAYHGKSTKRCYFLLREDFLLFSRYQQQTKFLWENHIETMDELLAYKENAEVQIQQLARQRKVLYRQKREPERAAREEKIKSLTQQMKALRHEVYICSDIETDAAEVQEKLRQAELAAQEERNEVKQDEQRRRSSRSDGAGSLTGYRSSH